jgi:hypothetical protein
MRSGPQQHNFAKGKHKMQRLVFLILGLVIGLGGYASAANVRGDNTGYITASASGLISTEGKILRGQDFTVAHPQRGEYVLTFEQGYFGRVGCAALIVEGVHHAILSRVEPNCSSPAVTFDIYLVDPSGERSDRVFGFVAVAMQPYY